MMDSKEPTREVSELEHSELRSQWEEIVEKIHGTVPSDEHPDDLWDRRLELWEEMVSRVDSEPPACPDCGVQSWTQPIGDAKACNGCGNALSEEDIALVREIDDYWEMVMSGVTDDG